MAIKQLQIDDGTVQDIIDATAIHGSGTSGSLAKFSANKTITDGPALGSSTTTFLRNDGEWAVPSSGGDVPTVTKTATPSMTASSTFTGTTATISLDTGATKYLTSVNLQGFSNTTVNNISSASLASNPSFTGTTATISVSGTPSSTLNLTPTTVYVNNVTAAALDSNPSFTGTTATITANVSGLSASVSNPSVSFYYYNGDEPAVYCTHVTNWNGGSASLTGGSWNAGTMFSASVSGDTVIFTNGTAPSYTKPSLSFTPATASLTHGAVPISGELDSTSITFTGTPSVSFTYQPAGTISKPNVTLTKTSTTVVTGVSGSVSGNSTTFTGSYQPAGVVSKPNISLTSTTATFSYLTGITSTSGAVSVSGSYQPAGTISTTISGGGHTHGI